jgi:hypothetical protein
MAKRFSKILVAQHSPKNSCFADDGTVLFVEPLTSVPLKANVAHYFLSTSEPGKTSRYGWVAETDPFDLDDFVRDQLGDRPIDEARRAHLEVMLNSIAKLKPGTPVAATYSARGIENKRMEFTVHRVLFHGA